VLVVDDRPDVRLSLLYMLEASGFEVAEAADGRGALSMLAKHHIDVILTDLYMPGMDGVGLISAVRDRLSRAPRIIAMTGSTHMGREATIAAATAMGAEAVLIKPFTREQLIRAIQNPPDRQETGKREAGRGKRTSS